VNASVRQKETSVSFFTTRCKMLSFTAFGPVLHAGQKQDQTTNTSENQSCLLKHFDSTGRREIIPLLPFVVETWQ
jgi:hypothetical protein